MPARKGIKVRERRIWVADRWGRLFSERKKKNRH
jgi:hypothetical protein